jgi:hypothetical protein
VKSGDASDGGFSTVMPPSQHTLSRQMMKNMDIWVDKIANVTNRRMLEQWALHKPQTIKTTSTEDLDPVSLADNDHPSVLTHELFVLETGDPPSRTLTWKTLGFLRHVKRRTNDDHLCQFRI